MTTVVSIQVQTFHDSESWIMGDQSYDGSRAPLRHPLSGDAKVRLVDGEILGHPPHQQRATKLLSAPCMALINSDIFWMPERLKAQFALTGTMTIFVFYLIGFMLPPASSGLLFTGMALDYSGTCVVTNKPMPTIGSIPDFDRRLWDQVCEVQK